MSNRRERLTAMNAALAEKQALVARLSRQLDAAPSWFRAGQDVTDLDPRRRAAAAELTAAARTRSRLRAQLQQLEREQRALLVGRHDPSGCAERALEWVNAATVRGLLAGFRRDPTIATGDDDGLDEATAATIIDRRNRQPGRRFETTAQLQRSTFPDDELMAHLEYSGCWVTEQPEDLGPLAVLLPLHLQTRFVPPDGEDRPKWTLQIMITPDSVFFHRHRPIVAEAEQGLLDQLWATCEGDLSTDAGREAFGWLAAAVGGGRAAWLVRRHPPTRTRDGTWTGARGAVPVSDESRSNQIFGLPDRLDVWLKRSGGQPERVDELQVDRAQLNPADGQPREWLTSFAASEAVGLATAVELDSYDDLETVFVVGMGDDPASALFEAHRDAGELAILGAGTPTNSVPERVGADVDSASDRWFELAQGIGDDAATALSVAVTGSFDDLGPVPGDNAPHTVARDLATALWPVLFGAPARSLWGLDRDAVAAAADWASLLLWPEGPLPPIRVADQPYGVLPAGPWSTWNHGPDDPEVEAAVWPHLSTLWRHLSELSEARGNVVGAEADEVHELLSRTASSQHFSIRGAEPLETVAMLLGSLGRPFRSLVEDYRDHPANVLQLEPVRALLTTDGGGESALPLVVPDNLPASESLELVLRRLATWDGSVGNPIPEEPHVLTRPRSLLYQLLYTAMLVAQAEVVREETGVDEPALEPLVSEDGTHTRLESDALAFVQAPDEQSPARDAERRVRDAISAIAGYEPADLERAVRATLDTAHHRVDPFLQGVAWRRYREQIDRGATPTIGAYGWVDGPRPGPLGPTEGGLIFAPTHDQLVTAVVARDAAVRDPKRWALRLDSASIRDAVDLAGDVRRGLHLSIALGIRIEATLDPGQVAVLRENFPLRDEDPQWRICDGLAVIRENDKDLEARIGFDIGWVIGPLRQAIDSYGDLALLDGIHNLVQGRSEGAGAAMDAAAALARPPDLRVLDAADRGDEIETTVLLAWQLVDTRSSSSPAEVAEPALVAMADRLTDQPLVWRSADGRVEYRLGDVGLSPADLFVVAPDELARVFARLDDDATELRGPGIAAHQTLCRRAAAMTCGPATAENVGAADDDVLRVQLAIRLDDLRALAAELLGRLDGREPRRERQRTLAALAAWGVRSADGTDDESLAAIGRAELEQRRDAVADIGTSSAISELSDALRTLAVGGHELPQFSPLPRERVRAELATDAPDATVMGDWLPVAATLRTRLAALEAASLEAELDGHELLTGWTSRSAGPWSGRTDVDSVIVLGQRDLFGGMDGQVAVGVLDGWNESRPRRDRVGRAAFGLAAPPARPPQAVLLATPGDPDGQITTDTLVDIVADTRRMALARAVDPMTVRREATFVPAGFVPHANIDLEHH